MRPNNYFYIFGNSVRANRLNYFSGAQIISSTMNVKIKGEKRRTNEFLKRPITHLVACLAVIKVAQVVEIDFDQAAVL